MCDNNCFYQEYELEPYIPPPEYDCRDCRNWNKRPRTDEPTAALNQPAEVSSGVVTVEKPKRPGTTSSTTTRSNRNGPAKECPSCTSSWYDPSLLTVPPPPSGTYNPSQYDPENPFQDQMYGGMGWPEPLPPGNQMIRGRPPLPPGFSLPPETSLPNAFSRPPQLPRPPPALTQPANTYTEFQPYRYPDPPALAPAIPPQIESCFPPPPPDLSNVLFDDYGFPEDNLGEPPIEPPSNICKTIALNNEYEENVDSWFSETAPPPPPPPPPPPECTSTWVEVASEGQTVTFTQQVDVAFGYNIDGSEPQPSAYRYNVTGPITFSNEGFGSSLLGAGKKGWFRCATSNPPSVPGCMDPAANNYNPQATVDDGSCTYNPLPVPGCMDPAANNYNPQATVDDGSCTYNPVPIPGCTDPAANNYNPQATVNDGSCTYNPTPIGSGEMTPDASVRQNPSAMQMIKNITAVTASPRHDPDGISWISPAIWAASSWDGNPLPTGLSNPQLCQWFRPTAGGAYVVKGLRERFYQVNPFADNSNPTVKEIEDWNLEVIRHFRALVGSTVPVRHNPRLYLEARWSQERKRTQVWDSSYPITRPEYNLPPPNGPLQVGWSQGPCWLNGNPYDAASTHCGDGFFPFDTPDRVAYTSAPPYNGDTVMYPDLANYNARYSQAVGIISVNHNVPWSIKMALVISTWICTEGLGGHAAPYLAMTPSSDRTEFGCTWWWLGGGVDEFRGKWAG